MSVLADAKQYLFRYGCATDTTIDPVDLVRELVEECEILEAALEDYERAHEGKKPKARPKGGA